MRLYDITSGSIYYKGYRISGGTRWNEKEIKWSRIHTAEKVKALKEEEAKALLDLSDSSLSPEDIEAKSASLKNDYAQKISVLKSDEKKHVAEQREIIKQIQFDNHNVDKKLLNEIQMIFQDPVDSLDPRMTVEDIIQEGLHIQHHYNKADNHAKCVAMLEKVGLIADYASRYPHEFSGGQRQRIGIARALVMNPRMLICDEPISALDVSIRAQILNLLNDIKEEMGITIMFIAHDLSVVKYFCDRIGVMYFGSLVEMASSDELFKHPLHPYTKALLSAIPKPDPASEKNRIRQVYNPSKDHDYSKQKPTFQEVLPGHFVLANDEEMVRYRAEIASLDNKGGTK
jgi:oligopeptide transport system ATP-binding protein